VNGGWIIFDEGFYPYDFYPYDSSPYDYSYDNYDTSSAYAPSSYDNRGSIVLEVQVALQNAGYDPGPTDGVFGPSTREAISRYQRDQGLEVTGSITDPVLQALGLD